MGWKSVHALPSRLEGHCLRFVSLSIVYLRFPMLQARSPPSTCEVSSQIASDRLLIEMRSGMEIALSSSKGLWLGRPGHGRNSIHVATQTLFPASFKFSVLYLADIPPHVANRAAEIHGLFPSPPRSTHSPLSAPLSSTTTIGTTSPERAYSASWPRSICHYYLRFRCSIALNYHALLDPPSGALSKPASPVSC